MNKLALIDTHVHYYPFCTFPEYFDSAFSNMQDAASKIDSSNDFTYILCLLETRTSHWYKDLLAIACSSKQFGDWLIESQDNNQVLRLSQNDNKELLILPGQQIITSENLELLTIGTTDEISHDSPAHFYINKYSDTHLVILPWGVGKWLGNRGRIVSDLIRQDNDHRFALGDNSGRASLWKHIPQFDQARSKNINILAGSDPLPIAGQQNKVASYGSIISGALQPENLAHQIRLKLLDTQANSIRSYGHIDSLFRFIISQLLLRLQPIKSNLV